MSEISAPLRLLLEKDISWHWEEKQKEAFKKLKELASGTPVLAYYYSDKEVVLNVDASSFGLGAVLLQEGKPLAYAHKH